MLNKINKTLNSLLKKDYTVEFWSDNNFIIMLSFYHLNSVYNGLCYISKDDGRVRVDFQYHNKNKTVEKQLKYLCENVYKLYNLKQFEIVKNLLENYHNIAIKSYKEKYSFFSEVIK